MVEKLQNNSKDVPEIIHIPFLMYFVWRIYSLISKSKSTVQEAEVESIPEVGNSQTANRAEPLGDKTKPTKSNRSPDEPEVPTAINSPPAQPGSPS